MKKPSLLIRALALVALLPCCLATDLKAETVITRILGRPTDRSVTLNARGNASLEMYVEYGSSPGNYASRTESVTVPALTPAEFQLDGLAPNSRSWYRLRYRPSGSSGAFEAEPEGSFHTQRAPASPFTFCLQGDSHPERASQFDGALYERTLNTVATDQPDFYFLMGDDFSIDTLKTLTAETVAERYTIQLPYLARVARTSPLFLVNGNHEQAARYLLDGTPNSPAVWAQNARNRHYPQPGPDGFYSGNEEVVPHIGLLRNTFAFTWGDALFVAIDPYWSSPVVVDGPLGGGPKTPDKWDITLGDAQYFWLKRTLEESKAKWKFVFAHHVAGTGRGGIENAGQFEWGGKNENGSWGFSTHRPSWPLPIHQLMAQNKVTIFFQGHDHLFVRQDLDGVIYQELPEPADPSYTLWNSDAYTSGDKFANTGYVRVTVSATAVKVEYVKTYLPKDESAARRNGEVAFSYTVGTADPPPPPPAATWIVPAAAHVPGEAGAFWTTDLTVANTGTSQAEFGIKFLGHDVDGRNGLEKRFTLDAGRSATYSDLVSAYFGESNGYGGLRVTANSPSLVLVAETSTPRGGGTFGQSVPAFSNPDLISRDPISILGIREDGLFRTNLILTNAAEKEIDADVTLVAETGAPLGSRRVALPPLGMTQLTRVAKQLGVDAPLSGARLVLSTETPGGTFAAYAVLIDNTTGDPRTLLPR